MALALVFLALPLYYLGWKLREFTIAMDGNPECSLCQHVTADYDTPNGKVICRSCSSEKAN